MGVVLVEDKVTSSDLRLARQDYEDYVKITVDIASGRMAIGGQWHTDGEKLLILEGSKKSDLWGGGVNLLTNQVETFALINLKPGENNSQEILDPQTREKFIKIVKEKFNYE
jgi:hypothetical protein